MRLPPTKDQLLSQSASFNENGLVNVVQVPLESCIIGEDLPTLVEKLKYETKKKEESRYAPWLALFPTLEDFADMPRFWNDDRLDFVNQYDGGQLEGRLEIDKQRLSKFHNSDVDSWALACVDSRSNFLPDETYSITPMLDMFNHDASYKTSARVDGGNRLLLEVGGDSILGSKNKDEGSIKGWTDQILSFFQSGNQAGRYQPGKEVFVSYGSFDSVETLCNYGFVSDQPNICNIEQFKVRTIGITLGPTILVVTNQGNIDNLFNTMSLDALRLRLATTDELQAYKEKTGKVSERNEIEVFALIAGELEEAACDAKAGVAEAEARMDSLVARYLRERHRTLELGLKWLGEKYPQVF